MLFSFSDPSDILKDRASTSSFLRTSVAVMEPLITVLIPAYNAGAYFDAAVSSIRNQTFTNFHLLIINDGSTDETLATANRHAAQDPRIRVISRPNRGLVPTLNEGLAETKTPFLARMDADDIAESHRLEKQISYLLQSPEVVCVGSWVETIDERGRRIRIVATPTEHAEIDAHQLAGHTSIIHPAATFRTATARAVGGYREECLLAEDLDLWLRMAELGQLHNLPEPLLQYRVHAKSISSTNPERQMKAVTRACTDAWARRQTPGQVTVSAHWRPGKDRHSRLRYALDTGWQAFLHGHRRTALVYGAKAFTISPWSTHSWKLLACAAMKPLPAPLHHRPRSTIS
jgi:glycosyltransferase involved in cell wall biosynthesis